MSDRNRPMCCKCGWAMGGPDSWDGNACKCGTSAAPMITCPSCNGLGTKPSGIGQEVCQKCDGSGLAP